MIKSNSSEKYYQHCLVGSTLRLYKNGVIEHKEAEATITSYINRKIRDGTS